MYNHDKALRDIARKRFDGIKYDVYTNPGGEKNAYVGPDSNPLYPDIVVLEKGYGRSRTAIAIGEVETQDSINEIESKQWANYSATKIPFYLYIPTGCIKETIALLNKKNIKISGLRAYRYSSAGELIVINIL